MSDPDPNKDINGSVNGVVAGSWCMTEDGKTGTIVIGQDGAGYCQPTVTTGNTPDPVEQWAMRLR